MGKQKAKSADYQKGFDAGYIRGVQDLGTIVSNLIAVGQFEQIVEHFEAMQAFRLKTQKREQAS